MHVHTHTYIHTCTYECTCMYACTHKDADLIFPLVYRMGCRVISHVTATMGGMTSPSRANAPGYAMLMPCSRLCHAPGYAMLQVHAMLQAMPCSRLCHAPGYAMLQVHAMLQAMPCSRAMLRLLQCKFPHSWEP